MKALLITIAVFFFLLAGVTAYFWLGSYNVAATEPHWKITHWVLEEVRDRSISAHSRGIISPPSSDPKLIQIGFTHFHAMCRLCHGAPGFTRMEFALGLYPDPPPLSSGDTQSEGEAELFWIVKNGLKMTGMPAFGPTHSTEELWGIVSFLRRLPKLNPEEYGKMVKAAHPEKHVH